MGEAKRRAPGGYIVRNQYGAFCAVCQSPPSMEEDDFDECDTCGGEGIREDDDDD
jgi:rRNA maturation endonuclease Nob1